MKQPGRVILTAIIAIAAYYFTFWVPFSLIPTGNQYLIASLVSAAVAVLAGRVAWTATDNTPSGNSLASSIVGRAVLVGGIGFFTGFFGPLVFMPDANQRSLLGIFITGPGGFVLGAVWGVMHWLVRRRRLPE